MCVGRFETYEDEDLHFSCEKEMIEYSRKADLYVSCLRSQQDRAEKTRKKALQDWECRSIIINNPTGIAADCKR